MSAAVVGDEVEVVRKWSGEHLAVAKLVALGLSVELDEEVGRSPGRWLGCRDPLERCP